MIDGIINGGRYSLHGWRYYEWRALYITWLAVLLIEGVIHYMIGGIINGGRHKTLKLKYNGANR